MAQKVSVLITGCIDGGIGSALASAFLKHGFHVFATARNVKSMSKLEKLEHMTFLTLDVTERSQVDAAVKAVNVATGGTLTYRVSNAGCNYLMPLLDENIEDAKQLYDINLWGSL